MPKATTTRTCPVVKHESDGIVPIILLAYIRAGHPQKVEPKRTPIIKYKGEMKEKREDRIVANRFNILIPVGIAIIVVAKVR